MLAILSVVNVVQHCSDPNLAKTEGFGDFFARRRLSGSAQSKFATLPCPPFLIIDVGVRDDKVCGLRSGSVLGQLGCQNRVF